MVFKFFSRSFLHDYHIKALKDSRRVYVKNKVMEYDSNFVEHVNSEKGILVLPKKDELLDMINNVERFDYVIHAIKTGEYCNYIYDDLPDKLKKYMREKDHMFFTMWLRRHKNCLNVDYDAKEGRLQRVKGEVTVNDFEKHVMLGKPIPSTIGKKAKESSRRSYKEVNALIKCNINDFKYFVTLTFANEGKRAVHLQKNKERDEGEIDLTFKYIDGSVFEVAKKKFSALVNNLKKQMENEFKYICIWELQQNGNYHFHFLCNDIPQDFQFKIPKWLDYDYRKKRYNQGVGLSKWVYGKSDVQLIESPSKLTTYVSKYIIKSFLNVDEESYEMYLSKKKYFPSKNLKKPTLSYYKSDLEVNRLLDEMVKDREKGFKKIYENPYNNSQIIRTVYTLV